MTPKQRMLNAYRGMSIDRPPVAPEFWKYYPARILGVDMVQLEREIPLWIALHETFSRYRTEGWGTIFVSVENEEEVVTTEFKKIDGDRYREIRKRNYRCRDFTTQKLFSRSEPSSIEKYPVEKPEDLAAFIDMELSETNRWDFEKAKQAYWHVGEDYLLEFWLGVPFFDFIAEAIGFEKAVLFFLDSNDKFLEFYRYRYTEFYKELVNKVCQNTNFESMVIGCSFSCNSLIGPEMWRRWDKPYIQAIAKQVHQQGRLLHVHFHGKSMEVVADFAEMGLDCVCPFERPPGGDVSGYEGLRKVRKLLDERVTMNGNVHTVETLIRGCAKEVEGEVREIKKAFQGSHRFIIGTGDQVGRETPEENIWAMVEEAKKQ